MNNEASHIIAFLWKTTSEVFDADDHAGQVSAVAYAPYSLRHPMNESGNNVPVDQNHESPLDGATAQIWHSDTHLLGLISFRDSNNMMQIANRMAIDGLVAVSPEVDHIESTFVEFESEYVKLITSARVRAISLVRASANPSSRCWLQPWEINERPFASYDPEFEKDWNLWRTAHAHDPGRVAQASINARHIRELYQTNS